MNAATSRTGAIACAGAFSLAISIAALAAPPPAPSTAAQVLADPIRPAADVARDADRKPAEMLAFAGIRPGMTIAELAPGGGYFTRILTGAVGSSGHVYAITTRPSPAMQDLAQHRPNLTVVSADPGKIPVPGKVPEVRPDEPAEDPVVPGPRPEPARRPEPGPMPEGRSQLAPAAQRPMSIRRTHSA